MTSHHPEVFPGKIGRMAIILNSLSAKKSIVYQVAEKLKAAFSVEVHSTQAVGDDERFASKAVEDNVDIIIAAGGDGTLHNVVNGVLLGREHHEKLPAIALLPAGSGNDFARTMGITDSVGEFIRRIKTPTLRFVDVGKIIFKFAETPVKTSERYFINETSVGLGPEVLSKLKRKSHVLPAGINYYLATLQAFYSYKPVNVKVLTQHWKWQSYCRTLSVANGRYFGHGLCIAPDAKPDDGKFSVFLCGNVSALDFIRYSGRMKKGKKVLIPEIDYKEACEVELSSDSPCLIEADGELVGELPVAISLLKTKLLFVI